MPLKKSKRTATGASRSSAEHTCSEAEVDALALEMAAKLIGFKPKAGYPRVLLSGPMGAGKSTFARAFLESFGVDRAAEGSPTFAIAHEYESKEGVRVIHADGYRLKSESELEETGLIESLWEPDTLILFEWMDLFPDVVEKLRGSSLPVIEVHLDFMAGEKSASVRDLSKLRFVRVKTS